jgi:hypothetical protein
LLSPEFMQLAAMMLAGLAVGGVVYVLVMPFVSGERRANKRVASVAQGKPRFARGSPCNSPCRCAGSRCRTPIKDIEAKQKARKRVPLRIKLTRAGLRLKPRSFYLLSLAAGVFGGFIVLITGSSPIVSLLAAFACGLGLPRFILARVIKRRQAKFSSSSTTTILRHSCASVFPSPGPILASIDAGALPRLPALAARSRQPASRPEPWARGSRWRRGLRPGPCPCSCLVGGKGLPVVA